MSTNNRMVEKSKKAIKDALLDIMYEKDFKQITVNELLKRANVSRGTFYAHFSNLEDVRQQLINDLFDHADYLFGDYTASELEKDPYPIMLMAADMMIASRDPAKRLFKFVNVYDLGSNLKTWLTKYILSDNALVERWGGEEAATIYARFISGGVMHAYNLWILEDFEVTAEVFAKTLCNILVNGLKAFEVKE